MLKTGVVKHEAGDINNSYTMDQIDTEKVKNLFLSRQEGDNRYRKEADKQQGIIYEIQRIETLCYEIDFTKRLFRDLKEVFYYYAIGEQSYNQAVEHAKDQALIQSKQQVFEQNKQKNLINYGVEKLAYGIDFDKIINIQFLQFCKIIIPVLIHVCTSHNPVSLVLLYSIEDICLEV